MRHDDWRRQGQERYLSRRRLRHQDYRPYRPGWDHDHCEFCGLKFSTRAGSLSSGFCTEDGYYWVCPTCFEDFRDEFQWVVDGDLPSTAD